jgi:sulfate/thiosulfate transport system permease protein
MLGRQRRVIPGFGLSLGFTLFYLSLIVLIPLAGLFWKAAGLGLDDFVRITTSDRAMAAYRLTFLASLIAALVNGVLGLVLAWVLVRYRFPGRRLLDALVDFPLALPTAVAGLTYSSLYVPSGWLGQYADMLGIKVSYTQLGVIVVLTFIALPFVVRTVQPVLDSLDQEIEEASATLGASRLQTIMRVIVPGVLPALLTGVALAFARAVGEYGSVIFIAGNLPNQTEIAPLLVIIQLEQFSYAGASAIAVVLLLGSFLTIGVVNLLSKSVRGMS